MSTILAILFSVLMLDQPSDHVLRNDLYSASKGPEIVLHLKSTLISGTSVKIGYEIPYDGYIEFLLFNEAGEKIWYTSSVRVKGEHFLAVKREPLKPKANYTFEFWYKGKKYLGSFNNS